MNIQRAIRHIDDSISRAEQLDSMLPQFVLDIDGMSSRKGRHLFNNLLSYRETAITRYLEIGSWKGSLFCSAIFNNPINATSIDNFSEFNGTTFRNDFRLPYQSLKENVLETVKLSNIKATAKMIQGDCFSINLSMLDDPFDFYLYDGEHSYDSHYKAYTYFDLVLKPTFITIIDDYPMTPGHHIHDATEAAWKDLGYTIIKSWHLFKETNGDLQMAQDEWWNGYRVALIHKSKAGSISMDDGF